MGVEQSPLGERRVSHYRTTHRLGAGGMGEVYAGVDETLKRRVALKAIRPDHRLSAESKSRFLREARILSQLDHPNICRVYDYIDDEAGSWLVLELIEGKTLRVAARDLDRSARLKIAEQIAAVLVVTHAAGVVHRDLKPGNVMITPAGDVKVLDFGLASSFPAAAPPSVAAAGSSMPPARAARPADDFEATLSAPPRDADFALALEATQFQTSGGSIMGTVGYMSPEQASGEAVGAASDMYSFGLLLQELLTGAPPFDRTLDYDALLEKARRGESLAPVGVPGDLASLIERLKSRAPTQRPTAVEAADRLRWIREAPTRTVRRVLVAGAVLVLALAGAKYTIDLARERTVAVAARSEADRRREQAESLIEFMLGDLRRKLEPVGRLEILDDVGTKAMEYFGAVPEHQLSDRELLRRATALYQIGTVRIAQGRLDAAILPLQESLAVATTLSARKPGDAERLFERGQSEYWVGYVYWRRRNLDAALAHFREYLALSEQLVSMSPAKNEWQLELSYANSNIGTVLQERGDLAGALERFQTSLRINQALLAASPDNNTLRRAVAARTNAAAVVLQAMGRPDDALKLHREELALMEELVRREPDNANWQLFLAVTQNYIGVIQDGKGMPAAAADWFRKTIDIHTALVRRDPSNLTWQRELGRMRFRLGRVLLQSSADRAVPELQQAVDILGRIAQSDPTNVGWQRDLAEALHARGEARLALGDLPGATADAEATLKRATGALDRNHDDRDAARVRAQGLILAGEIRARRGDGGAAAESWQQALATIEPLATGSADLRFLEPFATTLAHLDRPDEARRVWERLNAIGYHTADRSATVRGTTSRKASIVR